MIQINLTTHEAHQVIYALRELASRRAEQAIDSRSVHNHIEAIELRDLSERIVADIKQYE